MNDAAAIRAIERHGILLVYPVANRPEPASLWSVAYPRRPMVWDWTADADPRVAEIWHLRERLARNGAVVYAKWFQGRATFFSRPVFQALLQAFSAAGELDVGLPREAQLVLEALEERSPLSVKALREASGLQGRLNEPAFQRALKALWTRLLIVGAGEVGDGAFPSLAVGATSLMVEELWRQRRARDADAHQKLEAVLAGARPLRRAFERSVRAIALRGRAG